MVLALNNWQSMQSHGIAVPTQRLSGSHHLYQSHLNLKALLKSSRSIMLRPPPPGNKIFFHFTRQCPPWAVSDPLHKKLLLNLSIFFIDHFFIENTVRKYMGIDDRTDLTSVSLPALSTNFPFQEGSFAATLSIRGWTLALLGLLRLKGRPKYLHGTRYRCSTSTTTSIVERG